MNIVKTHLPVLSIGLYSSALAFLWSPVALARDPVDPLFATWTLDVSKSHLAGPAPKSNTIRLEKLQSGYRLTQTTELPNGTKISGVTLCDFTGNPCQAENGQVISTTRVGKYEVHGTIQRAGKTVDEQSMKISKDGLTMTVTDKREQGSQVIRGILIYHRG